MSITVKPKTIINHPEVVQIEFGLAKALEQLKSLLDLNIKVLRQLNDTLQET